MRRDRKAEHARVAKEESDDTHVQRSAPTIQIDARGYQRCEQRFGRDVVQHDEVSPLGAEKGSLASGLAQGGRVDCGSDRPIFGHDIGARNGKGVQ